MEATYSSAGVLISWFLEFVIWIIVASVLLLFPIGTAFYVLFSEKVSFPKNIFWVFGFLLLGPLAAGVFIRRTVNNLTYQKAALAAMIAAPFLFCYVVYRYFENFT